MIMEKEEVQQKINKAKTDLEQIEYEEKKNQTLAICGKKKLICDYCGNEADKLVDTPYMADVGNKMCKKCWQLLDQETVGTFEEPIW